MDYKNSLLKFIGKINGCSTKILIDGGCTHNMIDYTFAKQNNINYYKTGGNLIITTLHGEFEQAELEANVELNINNVHVQDVLFLVTPAKYNVVLGKPWLFHNNPGINWRTHEITINKYTFIADVKEEVV